MPKTRQQKEEVLKQIESELKQAKGVTVTSFSGLSVEQDQELRQKMRENKVSYAVVKKTLLTKVFEKLGFKPENFENVNYNISIGISGDDEISAAKVVEKFAKDHESFKIIGGMLESVWIEASKVKELAKLPGKQELIAKTVRTIQAPLSGLVNVLAGNLRGLVNVLNAIKDKK